MARDGIVAYLEDKLKKEKYCGLFTVEDVLAREMKSGQFKKSTSSN